MEHSAAAQGDRAIRAGRRRIRAAASGCGRHLRAGAHDARRVPRRYRVLPGPGIQPGDVRRLHAGREPARRGDDRSGPAARRQREISDDDAQQRIAGAQSASHRALRPPGHLRGVLLLLLARLSPSRHARSTSWRSASRRRRRTAPCSSTIAAPISCRPARSACGPFTLRPASGSPASWRRWASPPDNRSTGRAGPRSHWKRPHDTRISCGRSWGIEPR